MDEKTSHEGVRRREFLQRSLAAGAVLSSSGLIAACGGSSSSSSAPSTATAGQPVRGGKLNVGFVGGGDNESLDPQIATADIDYGRGLNLYDRVTHFNPDLSVEPLLAESLEPSSDGMSWQIKLKSGVTFHDGKPLTANDVIYSYRRIVDNKLTGASRLSSIDLKNAKATDNLTVVLPLTSPFADLPAMLAEVFQAIVPEGTKKITKPNGTGPFKFVDWQPGVQSEFVKNPDYFVSGKPYFDTLRIVSIQDNTTRLNALQSGQIDAMVNVDFVQAKAHASDPTLQLVVANTDYVVPIYVRLDRAPFTDNRVRQALRLVADRPQLVTDVLTGYGTIGNDLFGKGTPPFDTKIPQRAHDPEMAKSLLKQAGHGDGLNITLYTSTAAPGMLESATAYAQQAKAANVNIKLVQTPADTYYTGQYYLKVSMGQTNYQGLIPLIWADALLSGGPYNETAWKKPAFDAQYRQMEAELDPVKRQAILDDMQQQQWDEGGYIMWGQNDTVDAANPNIKGIVPSRYYLLGGCDFKSYWRST